MAFKTTCLECGGIGWFKCREDCINCPYGYDGTVESACTPNRHAQCPTCQGSGQVRLQVEDGDEAQIMGSLDVEILECKYAMSADEIITAIHTSKTEFKLVGQIVKLVPAKKG